jgi:GTPase involved in cell partitioning and DNA repair
MKFRIMKISLISNFMFMIHIFRVKMLIFILESKVKSISIEYKKIDVKKSETQDYEQKLYLIILSFFFGL